MKSASRGRLVDESVEDQADGVESAARKRKSQSAKRCATESSTVMPLWACRAARGACQILVVAAGFRRVSRHDGWHTTGSLSQDSPPSSCHEVREGVSAKGIYVKLRDAVTCGCPWPC